MSFAVYGLDYIVAIIIRTIVYEAKKKEYLWELKELETEREERKG